MLGEGRCAVNPSDVGASLRKPAISSMSFVPFYPAALLRSRFYPPRSSIRLFHRLRYLRCPLPLLRYVAPSFITSRLSNGSGASSTTKSFHKIAPLTRPQAAVNGARIPLPIAISAEGVCLRCCKVHFQLVTINAACTLHIDCAKLRNLHSHIAGRHVNPRENRLFLSLTFLLQ
jgi:hypothetical protein